MIKHKNIIWTFILSFLSIATYASPFYVGMNTGIGSSNWSGLDGYTDGVVVTPGHGVTPDQVFYSAPRKSDDTGMTLGAYAGLIVNKYVKVEALYIHLPESIIQMDMSTAANRAFIKVFYPNMPADGRIHSNTEAFNLTIHLQHAIAGSKVNIFTMVGPGYVYRHDILADRGVISAAFGFGLNSNISQHINAEVSFTYMTGKDTATVNPVSYYVPYIDVLNFGLSYQL